MKRMGALVGKLLPGIEKRPGWKQQTQINKQNQARKEITKEKKQMHGFGIDVGPINSAYGARMKKRGNPTSFGTGGSFG